MPRLASVISSAGTPSRGTPGTYPALIGTASGIRSSRTGLKMFAPMTLTRSENRSSSVIWRSVSCARRSASSTRGTLLGRDHRGGLGDELLLVRHQHHDGALARRGRGDVGAVDGPHEPALAAR